MPSQTAYLHCKLNAACGTTTEMFVLFYPTYCSESKKFSALSVTSKLFIASFLKKGNCICHRILAARIIYKIAQLYFCLAGIVYQECVPWFQLDIFQENKYQPQSYHSYKRKAGKLTMGAKLTCKRWRKSLQIFRTSVGHRIRYLWVFPGFCDHSPFKIFELPLDYFPLPSRSWRPKSHAAT